MVTNIGTTTHKVIITDHASKTGTFNLYLNPEIIAGFNYQNNLLLNEAMGNDNSLQESWGASSVQYIFQNCRWPLSGSGGNMELLKRALQYWSVESTKLYLWILDKNSYNQATWGANNGASVAQIRCYITNVTEKNIDADNHIFNVSIIRTVA